MSRRGTNHPPGVKAEALRRYLNGEPISEIGRALGVSRFTVRSWVRSTDGPSTGVSPEEYERSMEELSTLVYDTITETLNAIRARAIETGRPEWIKNQEAGQLASLDAVQWDRFFRVASALRPKRSGPPDEGEGGAEASSSDDSRVLDVGDGGQSELHRNGTVDPAV